MDADNGRMDGWILEDFCRYERLYKSVFVRQPCEMSSTMKNAYQPSAACQLAVISFYPPQQSHR